MTAMFHIATSGEHPPIPDHLSESCKRFLMRCFAQRPEDRSTADELLADPWLCQRQPSAAEAARVRGFAAPLACAKNTCCRLKCCTVVVGLMSGAAQCLRPQGIAVHLRDVASPAFSSPQPPPSIREEVESDVSTSNENTLQDPRLAARRPAGDSDGSDGIAAARARSSLV